MKKFFLFVLALALFLSIACDGPTTTIHFKDGTSVVCGKVEVGPEFTACTHYTGFSGESSDLYPNSTIQNMIANHP